MLLECILNVFITKPELMAITKSTVLSHNPYFFDTVTFIPLPKLSAIPQQNSQATNNR